MTAFNWCLFALVFFQYATGQANCQRINRPSKCNSKGERFKHGHKYEYRYEATTHNGFTGNTTAATGSRLSCRLVVSAPRKCELVLKMHSCELFDKTVNQDFRLNENSHRLANELKRYPVYLQYNDGEVINHQIAVFATEPQYITNIKRGIISVLQLKVISHLKADGNTFSLRDIFGTCKAHMVSLDTSQQMETYRDLLSCNLSYVSYSQASVLSFIKSARGGHRFSQIAEMVYPFKVDATCRYSVTPALTIETAQCEQRHVYHPLLSGSGIQWSPSSQIRQHAKLESDTSLLSQTVDHSLNRRHWKDLAMEFPKLTTEDSTGQDMLEELEQMVSDFLKDGNSDITEGFSAASFRTLVDKMRGATEQELIFTRDAVYSCHNSSCHRQTHKTFDPKMLQSIEERLFYNGLMSCGTDSCLAVFAACIRNGLLPDFEARSVVYNMGLFCKPSIKVIHIIFEHCRNQDSQICWLPLSAMIHRLTSSVQNNAEMISIVFETVSHLHHMIGEKCQRGIPDNLTMPEKVLALEKLLMAIKAITNIGETAGHLYHKKLHKKKSLTSALLHCVRNSRLSFIIARSAVQAIRSVGLQRNVVSELLNTFEDEKRPLALRAAIFDILILYNDKATLKSLLNILNTTKMENMQMYIRTKVSSLMESVLPEFYELKAKLGDILKDMVQPQLDLNMPFKSSYIQYSHHFNIPLMSLQVGGNLAVNLIYAPSGSVFQSLNLKISWILDNKTAPLFDLTIDLEGMDTFLEMMKKKEDMHQNQNSSESFLDMLEILHKYLLNTSEAEIPTFAHYSNKIKLAVKEIFRLANIPKASFPHIHFSVNIFGYEMGSISSNSLLMLIKEIQLKKVFKAMTEGIQAMPLRAFMLLDLHEVIPTVSGFPLDTRVDSSVVTKTHFVVKTDMEDYIKSRKHILTDVVLRPSISAMLQVKTMVSIGEYISSGTTLKTSGVVMGDWAGLVKYWPPRSLLDLEHEMHVICDLEQKPFRFLNIRSDMIFVQNDEEYDYSQTNLETRFHKCIPDIYTQFFGHKICVSGTSHRSPASTLSSTSLLLNYLRIEGILTPADKDLKYFSLHLKHLKRVSQPEGYYIAATFEGPGKELSRRVLLTVDREYKEGALAVTIDIPDAGITYFLRRASSSRNAHYNHKYASVLSRHGRALSSLVYERKGSRVLKIASTPSHKLMEYNDTKKSIHLNISFGALSLDVTYKDYVPKPTIWVTHVAVSYHCEPKLGLFYALHPDQYLAALQGHTSTFLCHQETYNSKTPLSETWKGDNKITIALPGQNIRLVTHMIADTREAHRVTDLYWKHGDKTDFFHMNSSVYNQSTSALFNFGYFLQLSSKKKFELDIEGHVQHSASLGILDISTDISFSAEEEASHERSKQLLPSVLSRLETVGNLALEEAASLYQATKKKLASIWGQSEQKSHEEYTEMNREQVELDTKQSNSTIQKHFWESLNWTLAIDTQLRTLVLEPGEGKTEAGTEYQWLVYASVPRGDKQVFKANGTIIIGRMMRLLLEDNIHDLKFNWEVEHNHTLQIFQHYHSWVLEDTRRHNIDQSFNLSINFEHYQQFEYDLILYSPWTNVTHHINYTKISPTDHTVRAFANVHSVRPAFHLVYYESSNMNSKELITHINVTSTILDYNFYLRKLTKSDGIVVEGELYIVGKFPILTREQTLSMSLALPWKRPPISEWTYRCEDRSGVKIAISLLGPNKITVGVKTLSPNVVKIQDLEDSVMWTLELVESRYLRHTVEFSPKMLRVIQHTSTILHGLIPNIVKPLRDMAVHYILADFKDKTLPLINKSIDELLKSKLQEAMDIDPESMMVKLLSLTQGGVKDISTILADTPIVQLIKGSHLDKTLATSVQIFANVLIDWAVHPPFFICHLVKVYIQPTLQQTLKSKAVTFSTTLPFVMTAFNRMPNLMALEKTVLGIAKARLTEAVNIHSSTAVILDGHIVKTFDGCVFHIAAPPMPACTYLLGADFKHGQFGLTYTREGVTVFSRRYYLTLARDGSVFTIKDHLISDLPYTSPDGQHYVSVRNGQIQLTFAEGLVDVTFNPHSDVYLIEIDRKLKNASIGLLGTNNHERGDDFLLANGSKTTAGGDFQNSYELTKNKKCLVSSFPFPALCKELEFPSCMSLSDKWQPAAPCLLVLSPQPFILKCHMAECQGQSGCSAVHAYFEACRHQGIQVEIPAVCAENEKKHGLDLVIIQSLHHSVIRDHDPFISCRTLVISVAQLDLSVGLVTYGGKGKWNNSKSHILNGKLMEKGRKAAQYMHFTVDKGKYEAEADAAIFAAAEYPFRSHATKIILLVHPRKSKQEKKDNANLLENLKARGIALISASNYPELEGNETRGMLSSREVPGLIERRQPPQDVYNDVVTLTSGMWFDLDMLNSSETQDIEKVANALGRMSMS